MVVTLVAVRESCSRRRCTSLGPTRSGLDWPSHPHWHNFVEAFHVANMAAIFKSSVLIVLGVVPVSVVIATMAGFALGHFRVRRRGAHLHVLPARLTLPFEGVIVPIYYEIRGMGLLNTRWAIILPLIGLYMPFGVYWMRAHFLNMPSELSEAARVDGATTWQLFWRIHVPLARPALASLGILLSVFTWNQFLLTIVLVDDPTKRTMAGALGAFQGQWSADIPLLSAGIAADPRADPASSSCLPAPLRRGAAARIAEGLTGTDVPLRLPDKWVWDFWLARSGDHHHVFFLQAPRSLVDARASPSQRLDRTRRVERLSNWDGAPRRDSSGPPGQLGRPCNLDGQRSRDGRPLAHALHRDQSQRRRADSTDRTWRRPTI